MKLSIEISQRFRDNTLRKALRFKMKRIITIFAFAVSSASANDGRLSFTSGIDYSRGKYGQSESTKIKYIPIITKYDQDNWQLKLTIPWIEIDGPGGATGGDSRIIIESNVNKHKRESGLGDIVAGFTYTAIDSERYRFILDMGGKVKFGTASTQKGLGTGENDYSLQTDVYKTLDKLTLLGTLGYRFIGNPSNADYKLHDVWYGTLGASYRFNSSNSMGLLLDLREATWEYGTNIREYTLYYSHRFNPTYSLQSYITSGDTKSSVDMGAGLMLNVRW